MVYARGADASKFGRPMSERKTLLAKAMVDPSILVRAESKGCGRAFPCECVTLVDGAGAWRMLCGLGQATVNLKPCVAREELPGLLYCLFDAIKIRRLKHWAENPIIEEVPK